MQSRILRRVVSDSPQRTLRLGDIIVSAIPDSPIALLAFGVTVGDVTTLQSQSQTRLGQQQPRPAAHLRFGVFVLVEKIGVGLDPKIADARQHVATFQAANHRLVDLSRDANPTPPGRLLNLDRRAVVETPAQPPDKQPDHDPGTDQTLLVLRMIVAEEVLDDASERSKHQAQLREFCRLGTLAGWSVLGETVCRVGIGMGFFGHVVTDLLGVATG